MRALLVFGADHFDRRIGQRHGFRRRFPRAVQEAHGRAVQLGLLLQHGFKFDFHVSFTPEQVKSGVLPYNYGKYKAKLDEKGGVSAFYRDKNGDIYHTYSSYERGIDLMNTTYNFLDPTAKGRDENPDRPQDWVRYHDEYKLTK
jgi:predicted dithiol-disulfide oxidoreductase (DUF899 family)